MKVSSKIDFNWTHGNLDRGRAAGYQAAADAIADYEASDVPRGNKRQK